MPHIDSRKSRSLEKRTIDTLYSALRDIVPQEMHKNRVSRVTFSREGNQLLMSSTSRKLRPVNRGCHAFIRFVAVVNCDRGML